ncbi:MAG: iron-sulfur cluster assembly accessory protein [Anaerolineales bacterium]|nr:iron-sulfur cluster assembly accessory protein [Anaerolineales bacterium]
MESVNTGTNEITLTEKAAAQVQSMIEERELENAALRVFVAGSGCSGLQYGMALDLEKRDTDLEFKFNGVSVLIDPMSLEYMTGSIIDFVENDFGAGFQIDNPNAMPAPSGSSCGGCSSCG